MLKQPLAPVLELLARAVQRQTILQKRQVDACLVIIRQSDLGQLDLAQQAIRGALPLERAQPRDPLRMAAVANEHFQSLGG